LFKWAIASFGGTLFGFFLAFAVTWRLETIIPSISLVIGMAAMGGLVGTLQWLVLQQVVSRIGLWIPATAIGLGCYGALLGVLGERSKLSDYVIEGLILGAVLGGVQGLVLRRKVSHAAWWILASTVSWAIGHSIDFPLDDSPLSMELFSLGGLIAYSVISGIFLVRLLRHPVAEA
jgi:hypothetical protein